MLSMARMGIRPKYGTGAWDWSWDTASEGGHSLGFGARLRLVDALDKSLRSKVRGMSAG